MSSTIEDINHYYPPVGFYFKLEIAGMQANDAAFQEVSGLAVEVDTETIQEEGENRFKHNLPDAGKYNNLVLKRGIMDSKTVLAQWCHNTLSNDLSLPIQAKDIKVLLLDQKGQPLISWSIIGAWPVKWSVSDFKSQDNTIVIETLEFAYQYFTRNNT